MITERDLIKKEINAKESNQQEQKEKKRGGRPIPWQMRIAGFLIIGLTFGPG